MTAPAPTVVRFCKPWRLYTGGETAGFPPGEAQWLIDNGFANSEGTADDLGGDLGAGAVTGVAVGNAVDVVLSPQSAFATAITGGELAGAGTDGAGTGTDGAGATGTDGAVASTGDAGATTAAPATPKAGRAKRKPAA
jgi:hypothetical protein